MKGSRFLGCFAASVILGACAGNALQQGSPQSLPSVERAAGRSLVYISDEKNNLVAVFNRSGSQVATIRTGLNYPQGVFIDGGGNLWVANEAAGNVLEYAPGASSPSQTLHDDKNLPSDVTMCPDGTVYVANVFSPRGGGDITVYPAGRTRAARTLTFDGSPMTFVTCDKHGNVFSTGVLGTFGTVFAFAGGRQAQAKQLPISGSGNLGGIKVDAAGNLLVDDGFARTVTEYTEAGSATGVSIATDGWDDIALDAAGATLFGAGGTQGTAVTFPGGTHVRNYNSSDFSAVIGIAVSPSR